MPPRLPPLPTPVLVRKKLMSPLWAAACGMRPGTAEAAASSAVVIMMVRMDVMEVLPRGRRWRIAWDAMSFSAWEPGLPWIIPHGPGQNKAPRIAPRRVMIVLNSGSADLLDRRQLPFGAGMTQEGPDLRDLLRLVGPVDH